MRCSTVVDGAVNGDVFEAFVEQVLVPELRPGDVVIMDNLSSHKRQRIRELIEDAGARLVFLPPYSPDLNPIELVFAKVKQLLRSMACRTRDALWKAMQSVLDQVTPSDAINCYKHCGYTLQTGQAPACVQPNTTHAPVSNHRAQQCRVPQIQNLAHHAP